MSFVNKIDLIKVTKPLKSVIISQCFKATLSKILINNKIITKLMYFVDWNN